MIKIVFFDMDGTLLDYGADMPSASTMLALRALQDKGVKIVVATGRPPYATPRFPGVEWDASIHFNGSLAFVHDTIVHATTISPADIEKLRHWSQKNGKPVLFAAKQEMRAPFFDPLLEEYMAIARQHCEVIEPERDLETFLDQPIYQGMIAMPVTEKETLLDGLESVDMVGWYPTASDLVPKGSSKGASVQKVLAYFGFSKAEAMAFGDGDNDLEMLQAVGLPVSMGNATPAVRQADRFVTRSVKADGIAYALRHFEVLA